MAQQLTAQHHGDQPGAAETHFVTLLTGDRVLVENGAPKAITRAPGREGVKFSYHRQGEHTYVLPEDAFAHVASGKVDRRLFDVAGLIQFGYDDAKRSTLPVLVTPHAAGVQSSRALHGTELAAAQAPRTADSWHALKNQLQSGVDTKIWLDGLRKPLLDKSTTQIGAPAAHRAGYTGKGVKVAVLDTGVDANHPDLTGKQLTEKNFTSDPDNTDTDGHGTHVAATIASGDAKYPGVAPDAQILDGKVCVAFGCAESWILGGMQWAAEQGADIVNMSLGSSDTPEVDPLEDAVNKLSAQYGTLFVVAAGNSGTREPVSSPSTADAALSVGAVDRDDSLASFSSRGPRKGDGAIKPEVTAPGVDIVAAKAGSSDHVALSGTSMAAPHTAGAAALLAQQHPRWTGGQIKAALVGSAEANPANSAYEQGAGRIDLAKAITQTLTTDPVTVGLGVAQWPHDDDKPVTEELIYHNAGTSDVTVDLKIESDAPAGMFTVSPSKLTIPAGGSAKAAVTGDSRIGNEDKVFSGSILATSLQAALRTPVGLQREVESYDITINHKDRAGTPTGKHSTVLLGVDNPAFLLVPSEPDGTVSMRLPKGRYYAWTLMFNEAAKTHDILNYSEFKQNRATTLDFDARKAKPISITGPDPTAKPIAAAIVDLRREPTNRLGTGHFFDSLENVNVAGLGPDLTAEQYSLGLTAWYQSADGAKHLYAFEEEGNLPTGYAREVRKSELAEVRTKVGPVPDGRQALFGYGVNSSRIGLGSLFPVKVPAQERYFVNAGSAGPNITFPSMFYQVKPQAGSPEVVLSAPARKYQAGRQYEDRINVAVFGPAMQNHGLNIARAGNALSVAVPMHADAPGRSGNTIAFDSAFTKLYRDGKLIGERPFPADGFFDNLPAGAATFRVEAETTRSVSNLSTRVTTNWTFGSDTVPGAEFKPVPLTVVRFDPKLDDMNTAPPGRLFRIPLRVQQQTDADNGRVRHVHVDASFDDGKTWQRIPVVGTTALVNHPSNPGFVSLRAKTVDTKGNTSDVTIIRAYRIG